MFGTLKARAASLVGATAVAIALVLVCAASSVSSVRGETVGSTVLFERHIKGVNTIPGSYNLLQEYVDFDRGAFAPLRLSASWYMFTIVSGSLSVTIDQATSSYGPGQSGLIPPGALFRYTNDSLAGARMMESIILLPTTGRPQAFEPASYPPVVSYMQNVPLGALGYGADVVQQGADLAAAYRSPERIANSLNVITVTAGELTLRYRDGAVEKYGTNQVAKVATGRPFSLANEGAGKASYIATWVSTPGTPALATAPVAPVAPVAPSPPAAASGGGTAITPPRTGDGGLLP